MLKFDAVFTESEQQLDTEFATTPQQMAVEFESTGNGSGVTELTAAGIKIALGYTPANEANVPTKTSQLTNDSGFIKTADIPTKTSQLTNDSGFLKSADIPTKTSQLVNDSGFLKSVPSEYVTESELAGKGFLTEHQDLSDYAKKSAIPTKTSQLTNDSGFLKSVPSQYVTETELNDKGFLTQHQDLSAYAKKTELPTKVSQLTNDKGYLTQHQDLSAYAKKSDISTVYRYKGSVATEAALPTSGRAVGDVYNIEEASRYGSAGMNVVYTGSGWDALGASIERATELHWHDVGEYYDNVDMFELDVDDLGPAVEVNGVPCFYYVTDATPTQADFENGWDCTVAFYDDTTLTHEIEFLDGYAMQAESAFLVIYEDGTAVGDTVFPKAGTYFLHTEVLGTTQYLRINGFQHYTKVVEPVPTKYLPDQLRFGDIEVEAHTVKSDGIVYNKFHKVSDDFVSKLIFEKGGTLRGKYSNGTEMALDLSDPLITISEVGDFVVVLVDGLPAVASASKDNPSSATLELGGVDTRGLFFYQGSILFVDQLTLLEGDALTVKRWADFDNKYLNFIETVTDDNGNTKEQIKADYLAGAAAPDWDAQAGEHGYIKNKPFGTELKPVETVLFEGFQCDGNAPTTPTKQEHPMDADFVLKKFDRDKEYKLLVNGVAYTDYENHDTAELAFLVNCDNGAKLLLTIKSNESVTRTAGVSITNQNFGLDSPPYDLTLTLIEITKQEIIHKVPLKYLPETSGGGGGAGSMVVTVNAVTMTADKAAGEVIDAIMSGVSVSCLIDVTALLGAVLIGAPSMVMPGDEPMVVFGTVMLDDSGEPQPACFTLMGDGSISM